MPKNIFLTPKVLAGDKSDGESGAEGFLQILTDCLAEGHLLLDYAKGNPIADDVELFAQAGIELDPTRVQYILDGIRSLAVELNDRIGEAEAKSFQVWLRGLSLSYLYKATLHNLCAILTKLLRVQMKTAKDDVAREKAEQDAARQRALSARQQQEAAGAGPSGAELDSLISQGHIQRLL